MSLKRGSDQFMRSSGADYQKKKGSTSTSISTFDGRRDVTAIAIAAAIVAVTSVEVAAAVGATAPARDVDAATTDQQEVSAATEATASRKSMTASVTTPVRCASAAVFVTSSRRQNPCRAATAAKEMPTKGRCG